MKILFTGGGTGGHIFPIIAIIREIKKIPLDEEKPEPKVFYYLGANDKSGSAWLLREEGVKVKIILTGKIRRYFSPLAVLENIIDVLIKIPLGILQAFWHLFFWAPDIIFSKGGSGSLPVIIAGWFLQIPIFLHESDVVPGFTNRLAARFALEVFVSFPKTKGFPPEKMLVVGNPIREELLYGLAQEGQKLFQLTGEKPVILILGGSQGAKQINDLVLNILPEWLKNFELIHIAGPQHYKMIKREAEVVLRPELKKYYHPMDFLSEDQLKHAYSSCHFIISRAGAGGIFEIAALGKPSILIPLPEAAQNHQLKNAYALTEAEGALVIEKANLTPHFLLERIKHLFAHPDEFRKLAQGARKFSKPKAAKVIGEYIIAFLTD